MERETWFSVCADYRKEGGEATSTPMPKFQRFTEQAATVSILFAGLAAAVKFTAWEVVHLVMFLNDLWISVAVPHQGLCP